MFLASHIQLDVQFPQAATKIFIEFASNHYVVTSIYIIQYGITLYVLMHMDTTFITLPERVHQRSPVNSFPFIVCYLCSFRIRVDCQSPTQPAIWSHF